MPVGPPKRPGSVSPTRLSPTRHGLARLGPAWPSPAWLGLARPGPARRGPVCPARLDTARPGPVCLVWDGPTRTIAWPGRFRPGDSAWPGPDRTEWTGPDRTELDQTGERTGVDRFARPAAWLGPAGLGLAQLGSTQPAWSRSARPDRPGVGPAWAGLQGGWPDPTWPGLARLARPDAARPSPERRGPALPGSTRPGPPRPRVPTRPSLSTGLALDTSCLGPAWPSLARLDPAVGHQLQRCR